MNGEPLASRISPIELPLFFRREAIAYLSTSTKKMPDAQPVTPTTRRPQNYQDEPTASSSRRQKDPKARPPLPSRGLISSSPLQARRPSEGPAIENQQRTCRVQTAMGTIFESVKEGQASKPQVCLHLWRRVSAYHEKTHGVSGDFLPKLCVKVERERTPFRCGSFDCDCLSEELRERKGRKFCGKGFCTLCAVTRRNVGI